MGVSPGACVGVHRHKAMGWPWDSSRQQAHCQADFSSGTLSWVLPALVISLAHNSSGGWGATWPPKRTNQRQRPVTRCLVLGQRARTASCSLCSAVCGTAECWDHHANLNGALQRQLSIKYQGEWNDPMFSKMSHFGIGLWTCLRGLISLLVPGEGKNILRMWANPWVTGLERTFAVRAETCRGMLAAHCQASLLRRPFPVQLWASVTRCWHFPRMDWLVEADTPCNLRHQTPNTSCLIQNMTSFI